MIKLNSNRLTFLATAQLFLSLSFLFGTWVIYIPYTVEKLGISKSELGITLFFASLGALFGTFFGKLLVNKFGEGKMSLLSILYKTVCMVLVFASPNYFWLTVSFTLWGLGSGILQIAVNATVNTIEQQQKVSIMSSCHGFFSLGALIASGVGTLLLIALNNAMLHIIIAATLVLALQLVFYKKYVGVKSVKEHNKSKVGIPKNRLAIIVVLAIIALVAMVSEGAIADWSGLYLKDVVFIDVKLLGLGYAGFSMAMTLGRFFGDYFSKKYGQIQIMLVGFIISLLGFILVLTAVQNLALLGFFTIGIGFSVIVPVVYRLSANVQGVDSAAGIAFIAGTSFVGFLAGPPLLGFIADSFGLTISFIALLGLVAVGTLLVIATKLSTSSQLVKSN